MGKEVAKREATVLDVVRGDGFRTQVARATPPGMSVERFMRVTETALQQNPDLTRNDQKSLYAAIVRCAQDGLLPDGREAALTIYDGKVQYLPMIGGLRKRAAEFGIDITAHVVYAVDFFEFELGLEPRLVHVPAPLGAERGEPIGAYAYGTDVKSGHKYGPEVMDKAEIEKVRAVSRAKHAKAPWQTWWSEMARKTVARRLFKSLPLHDESVNRLLASVDAEFEHPEEQVSRDIGLVGPPVDDDGPEDFVEGHVVEDDGPEEPAGEPDAEPTPEGKAATADTEPPSPAEQQQLGDDDEGSPFAAMADRAQRKRGGSKEQG